MILSVLSILGKQVRDNSGSCPYCRPKRHNVQPVSPSGGIPDSSESTSGMRDEEEEEEENNEKRRKRKELEGGDEEKRKKQKHKQVASATRQTYQSQQEIDLH